MGQKQRNVEAVTDFADGRHFVRLHRDILLPAEVCEAVRRHLAADRWTEAKSLTMEHAPADSHAEVELFFTPAAERPANGPRPEVATKEGHDGRTGDRVSQPAV